MAAAAPGTLGAVMVPGAMVPGEKKAPVGGITSLYVGDLSKDVTEQDLFTAFSPYGKVNSTRIPRDSVTRVSLGYGYVNFVDADSAQQAIKEMNYMPIKGKPCRIMPAQRDPLQRRSGVGNVCLKHVPASFTPREIYNLCSDIIRSEQPNADNSGRVLSVKVPTAPDGRALGFAFVQFDRDETAQTAIDLLNGEEVDDPATGGKVKLVAEKYVRKDQRASAKSTLWTNLLVKNVPLDWSEEDLKALFSSHGEVTSTAISRTPDGARVMGFVNMRTNPQAEAALAALDGHEVKPKAAAAAEGAAAPAEGAAAPTEGAEKKEGAAAAEGGEGAAAPIRLSVVRHQKKSERLREQRAKWLAARGLAGDAAKASANLYVKNLSEVTDDEGLRNLFKSYGTITSAKVMRDVSTGVSRGFGFVSFSSREEAEAAKTELHKKQLADGRPLYVSWFETKAAREANAAEEKRRAAAAAAAAAQQRGFMPGTMGGAAAGAGYPGMAGGAGLGMAGMGGYPGYGAGVGGGAVGAAGGLNMPMLMTMLSSSNPQAVAFAQNMFMAAQAQAQAAQAQQQQAGQQQQVMVMGGQQQGPAGAAQAAPQARPAVAAPSAQQLPGGMQQQQRPGMGMGMAPQQQQQPGAPMQQMSGAPRPVGVAPQQQGQQQAGAPRMAVPAGMMPQQQGQQQQGQQGARPMQVQAGMGVPPQQQQQMGAPRTGAPAAGYAAVASAPRPAVPGQMQAGPAAVPRNFAQVAAGGARPGVVLSSNAVVPAGAQQGGQAGAPSQVAAGGMSASGVPQGFLDALSRADRQQQRNMLGELLYPRIAEKESQLAGKITGMLLELETSEVLSLLDDPASLGGKVDEAVQVLKSVGFLKAGAQGAQQGQGQRA